MVISARRQQYAVRREGDRINVVIARTGSKNGRRAIGLRIHKRTVPFVARGSQARAVWREGHRPHVIAMTLPHQLLFFVVARGRRSDEDGKAGRFHARLFDGLKRLQPLGQLGDEGGEFVASRALLLDFLPDHGGWTPEPGITWRRSYARRSRDCKA